LFVFGVFFRMPVAYHKIVAVVQIPVTAARRTGVRHLLHGSKDRLGRPHNPRADAISPGEISPANAGLIRTLPPI
jgi:hypothetical protein